MRLSRRLRVRPVVSEGDGGLRFHFDQDDFVVCAEPHARSPKACAGGDVEGAVAASVEAVGWVFEHANDEVEGEDLAGVGVADEGEIDAGLFEKRDVDRTVVHED